MKVAVDHSLCIGCEKCVQLAPQVFSFDEDEEVSNPINPTVTDPEALAKARQAEAACPSDAISITDPAAAPQG